MSRCAIHDEGRRLAAKRFLLESAADRGVALHTLMGPSREQPLSKIRHEIWVRLQERGYSTPEIGWLFNRDHSTIVMGINRMLKGEDVGRNKDQGTAEETAIVACLHEAGFTQARRLAEGGSNDEGDVEVWPGGPVIECKARAALGVHDAFAKAAGKSIRFDALIWKRLVRKDGNTRRTPVSGQARVVVIDVDTYVEYLQLKKGSA